MSEKKQVSRKLHKKDRLLGTISEDISLADDIPGQDSIPKHDLKVDSQILPESGGLDGFQNSSR
jgi:hypothetical protein